MLKFNRYLICLISIYSDEAVAAFVETAGGSLKELSLNNVKKVNGIYVPFMPPIQSHAQVTLTN